MLGDHVDQVRLHDLGDHRQAGGLARLGQVLQPLQPQALEAIRARARLECPATQDGCPCFSDGCGGLQHHLPVLDRARPSHDRERAVADPGAPDLDDGVLGMGFPRRQLVGATDLRHRLDSAHRIQLAHQMLSYGSHVTQYRDHHTLGADIVVRAQPVGSNLSPDCFGFLVCRACGHHDDQLAVLLVSQPTVGSGSAVWLRPPESGSWSGNKKAEALPLLAPGTIRDPGPRLRERSCRVAVKEEDAFHWCSRQYRAPGRVSN